MRGTPSTGNGTWILWGTPVHGVWVGSVVQPREWSCDSGPCRLEHSIPMARALGPGVPVGRTCLAKRLCFSGCHSGGTWTQDT